MMMSKNDAYMYISIKRQYFDINRFYIIEASSFHTQITLQIYILKSQNAS